jgi:hypothetical protein
VCEVLAADELLSPTHPYTERLLASVPSLDTPSPASTS